MSGNILSLIGIAIGLLGLGIAYLQYRERVKAENALKAQLAFVINRVRAMVPYKSDLDKMLHDVVSVEVRQWAYIKFKGLSDLYCAVVSHYLASNSKFTYKDLERLVKLGTIQTRWEERVWRDLMALREENMQGQAPEFYTEFGNSNKHPW